MGSEARLDRQAFTEATRLPFSDIVKDISDLLGPKLAAYIAGVTETRAVQHWIEGGRPEDLGVEKRLRLTAQLAKLIAGHDNGAVAQAWFQGRNPELDDLSPAFVLREGDITGIGPKLTWWARCSRSRSSAASAETCYPSGGRRHGAEIT